jgi:Flp pilus assembly protein TadD
MYVIKHLLFGLAIAVILAPAGCANNSYSASGQASSGSSARKPSPAAIRAQRAADLQRVEREAATAAKEGNWVKAEEVLREGLTLFPDLKTFEYKLAIALEEQGKHAEALALYRKALTNDSKSGSTLASDATALHRYSELCKQQGLHSEAAEVMARIAPPGTDPSQLDTKAAFTTGKALLNRGQFGKALPLLRRAAQLAPTDAEAYYQLASCLRAMDRREEARAAFEKAAQHATGELRGKALRALR